MNLMRRIYWLCAIVEAALVAAACTSVPAPTAGELCSLLFSSEGDMRQCDPWGDNREELLMRRFVPGIATANDVAEVLDPYFLGSESLASGYVERYAILRSVAPDAPVVADFRYDESGVLVVLWVGD